MSRSSEIHAYQDGRMVGTFVREQNDVVSFVVVEPDQPGNEEPAPEF
ncbi:MAG TPA: hypothetical protein VFU07_05060 [Candidatus Lumbricidophila sp.]|nr:hypothetical protein [Candidatus Lumbricidophila sp.]